MSFVNSLSISLPTAGSLSITFDNCTGIPCDCSECPEDCSTSEYQHDYCVDITDGVDTESYVLDKSAVCTWRSPSDTVQIICASGVWQMEGPDGMLYVAVAIPDNSIPPDTAGEWIEINTGTWELSTIEKCNISSSSSSSLSV